MWGAINRDLWEIIICDTKELSLTSIIKIPYRQERRIKKKLNMPDISYDKPFIECEWRMRKHDLPYYSYIDYFWGCKSIWKQRFFNLAFMLSEIDIDIKTKDKGIIYHVYKSFTILPTGECDIYYNGRLPTKNTMRAVSFVIGGVIGSIIGYAFVKIVEKLK